MYTWYIHHNYPCCNNEWHYFDIFHHYILHNMFSSSKIVNMAILKAASLLLKKEQILKNCLHKKLGQHHECPDGWVGAYESHAIWPTSYQTTQTDLGSPFHPRWQYRYPYNLKLTYLTYSESIRIGKVSSSVLSTLSFTANWGSNCDDWFYHSLLTATNHDVYVIC